MFESFLIFVTLIETIPICALHVYWPGSTDLWGAYGPEENKLVIHRPFLNSRFQPRSHWFGGWRGPIKCSASWSSSQWPTSSCFSSVSFSSTFNFKGQWTSGQGPTDSAVISDTIRLLFARLRWSEQPAMFSFCGELLISFSRSWAFLTVTFKAHFPVSDGCFGGEVSMKVQVIGESTSGRNKWILANEEEEQKDLCSDSNCVDFMEISFILGR